MTKTMKNIHRERMIQRCQSLAKTPHAIEERKRIEADAQERQFWDEIRSKRDARITFVERIRRWWRAR